MKKVAIIFATPSPYRINLFNYIIKKYSEQFEFTIIFATKPKDFGRQWTIDESSLINTIFLKSKKIQINIGRLRKNTNVPINVFKTLNEINPDIIIASEYNPSIIASFIWTKLKKKKYISWSDGILRTERNINFVQKILRKIICKKSDALIASSTKTKETQITYGALSEKIFISYLTVDIDKYITDKNIKKENNNILFVGRLIKLKGLDLLLEAISKVTEEYKLFIIGDGEEKENLVNLCKKLSIENKVIFLGYLEGNDLKQYYDKCGIFIFPSLDDCFGLVLLEAMCANMALISSKYSGATYDIISEGVNGRIFDPYNINESAELINCILKDNDLCNRYQMNSQINLSKFSFNNVSKAIINAIEYTH